MKNPSQKRKVNKITLVVRTVEVSMAVSGGWRLVPHGHHHLQHPLGFVGMQAA